MFNNEKLISLIFICFWIVLWGSINSFIWSGGIIETYKSINFSKNLLVSISSIRSLSALMISIVIIIYFLYLVVLKKIKINNIHLLFILFFLCYIFGLLFNNEKLFNFTNNYLVILSFGSICLFAIIDGLKLNRIIIYFFWISLFFLIFAFLITMISKISEINSLNLYEIFGEETNNLLGETNPKITGLSRMLALINLFIFCSYIKLENTYLNILSKIFLILSSSIIMFMQSRGTIVCYFLSLSILILFINKNNKIRFREILIFILLPILVFSLTNNILDKQNLNSNDNLNINNRILSTSTSGRYEVWSYTIQNYDFKKKLFGYGSNGDRFFLKQFDEKDKYSDNTSSMILYSLVSGGPISLIILVIIFYKVLKVIMLNKSRFLSDRNNFYLNLSFIFLIFFLIRSFFENSFSLFSIDFLITYLSLSYILSTLDKKFSLNEKY